MQLKNIKNLNLKNKKVLMRVDFNVPMKNGKIIDDSRIQAVLPTLRYLIKKGARIILISHLGNPLKNQKLKDKKQFSLEPVAKYLNRQIKLPVRFIDDCIGPKVEEEVEKIKPGEIVLLENLRFYFDEEKNDLRFAKKIAELADIYVNEAFSVCHRQHASVAAITNFLPSYAGFLLEKEIKMLSEVLEKPREPFIVVMGGVKISTKIGVIQNLAKKADKILIGGALANNFFVAKGLNISQSTYEKEMIPIAKKLFKNKKIVLPIDVKIKLKIKNEKPKTQIKNIKIDKLNELSIRDFQILDIGIETSELFSKYLKSAKMIIWNGPMGYAEDRHFAYGTRAIIRAILNNQKAKIIIGGGETIACLRQSVFRPRQSVFMSTGGGAMLKFLEGKTLPGIKSLWK